MMHTELYCPKLDALDHVKAVRAVHQAWLQLNALGPRVEKDGTTYDNAPALASLAACLGQAGHVGFEA